MPRETTPEAQEQVLQQQDIAQQTIGKRNDGNINIEDKAENEKRTLPGQDEFVKDTSEGSIPRYSRR